MQKNGSISLKNFEDTLQKKLIAARSMLVDYAGISKQKRIFFNHIHNITTTGNRFFEEVDLEPLLKEHITEEQDIKDELATLVRQNILAYNPVTALFSLQGRSLEVGLGMYIARLAKPVSR